MSYHRPLGETSMSPAKLQRLSAMDTLTMKPVAASASASASGGGIGGVVIIGGLAVAGYLVYRHLKKKKGSTP
jgi:hypothetical protein